MQLKYRGVAYHTNSLPDQHHSIQHHGVLSAIALSYRGRLYLLERMSNVQRPIDYPID